MIRSRAARAAAHLFGLVALAATTAALAQSDEPSYSPTLREAVAAYRASDLDGAERSLRAEANRNPDAEAWLGAVLIDRGRNREAMTALQHAAEAGSSEANHRLGLVFAEGQAGTARNDQRAAGYFEKAANAGHRRAQINLAILYLRGQGVPHDLVQARAWLEKAAAADDPVALYTLGRAMEEHDDSAAADSVRAADLYRRAAEKGNALAALRYGLAFVDGIGVKRDRNAAQTWLLRAKDAGVPEAALALGDLAARTPASRDKEANARIVERAVQWYEVAANAGVPSAQFKLANAYFAGAGIARDPAQALAWYSRASQQGLPEAEHAFGVMLIGGIASPADPVEGYKWLVLAEAGGFPDSRPVREKAKGQIAPKDVEKAEALAKAFKPTLERPVDGSVPQAVAPQLAPPPAPATTP
jgi:TPR repeat protein